MRIVGDFGTFKILQVEKTPEIGEYNPFNGRFSIPVPDGAALQVKDTSYILPQDGNDVSSEAAAALLAQFPMYDNIVYNFLLEDTDVDDLDRSPIPAVTPVSAFAIHTRAQFGRGSLSVNPGQWPNMTAILPTNQNVSPARDGLLITDTIDIGPATAGAGADEFLVWWYAYEFDTTDDVISDFGGTSGFNNPANKRIAEVDQEVSGLSVYISHDDGVTWTGPIGRLEPTDLLIFDTSVRLAFQNATNNKVYLAAYAIMF